MKVSEIVDGARVICAGRAEYRPRISIVTPTYCRNAEGLLRHCIDSAAVQTFDDFEHIIIDDGSTDGSEGVLKDAALRDDRIVYIRHDKNSGLPGVRTNEGIMRARGDAIAFLFDDNVFTPDFLEKAWAKLEATGADVVVTNVEMLTVQGDPFFLGGWPQTIEMLRNLNTIPNGGVLVRRSFFDRVGLYDPHLLMRRVCDWDLWLRAFRLGAKIVHLDTVSAIESGLVSPNSLGNTIAWDLKITYAYMMDEPRFQSRSMALRPENIGEFDVLDPEPFFRYIRNSSEWLETVKTFYEPFYTRRAKLGLGAHLSNRDSVQTPPKWFSGASTTRQHRVMVVSNATTPWVANWLDVLRADPTLIVLHSPEWNIYGFRPQDMDLLLLFDCCYAAMPSFVEAYRKAGVTVVYIAGAGLSAPEDAPQAMPDPRHFARNKYAQATFGDYVYYAQPSVLPSSEQRKHGAILAQLATVFVGTEQAYRSLGATCLRVDMPELVQPEWAQVVPERMEARYTIAYDLPRSVVVDADEYIVPPVDSEHSDSAQVPNERASWESLGALVQVREGARIAIAPEVYEELSANERFALGTLADRHDVEVVSIDQKQLRIDRPQADLVNAWLRDFSKTVMSLRGKALDCPAAVFLNSEMFSGSEAYGCSLAKHLATLGLPVRVFVPDTHHYASDSGRETINAWLARNGIGPVQSAPYRPGAEILHADEHTREEERRRLAEFMDELDASVVVCSGFMPVFALGENRPYRLFMTLFQPSAYDMPDIAFLRGRVDGIFSDCEWSMRYLSRIFEGHARVLRTALPLDPSEATESVQPAQPLPDPGGLVRIAIGGTLQPRKRQLEAVRAAAILFNEGFDIELNIYGYALAILKDYVDEIDKTIERSGLSGRVRRHGLAPLAEIAANNDVILSASLDESLPQTLLELMRCGLIGAGVLSGGIDEVLLDGETGFLTRDSSAEGVAQVLRRALLERENWPAVRARAQALLATDYSYESARFVLADALLQGHPLETHVASRRSQRVNAPAQEANA
jgi:glycosyltransferase involved in cell wall biosynthesis